MNKEEQTWLGVFLVIPTIMGYNLADALAPDEKTEFIYSALFGGLGAVLGYVLYSFIKRKSFKIASATGLFAVGVLALYLAISDPSDKEILNRKWITQTIGKVQFDNPEKLSLKTTEIPEAAKWFYKELKMYSDGNIDRLTTFMDCRITGDTLSIVDAYSSAMEGMLKNHNVKPEELKLETFSSDEEEISAMFTFDLDGNKVNGYGLMPIKRGFSREYIEEFEAGIFPNYK